MGAMKNQFAEICQTRLPIAAWMQERTRRLPGVNPVQPGDWLRVDEVFGAQMAYRDFLLAERRQSVCRMTADAEPAALELLQLVLAELSVTPGFQVSGDSVTRPDGMRVALDRRAPLLTVGQLVQEDFCILQKRQQEHVLTGAVLCFPASWSLEEKFLKPLADIHAPVSSYTDDIARRVQRIFDALQADRPVWRSNFLTYANPNLHQPRRKDDRREPDRQGRLWLRAERQCMRRLPDTNAIVFSIHTYVVPFSALSKAQRASLPTKSEEVYEV
jgi:heme-dependent oxidative N-demethylase alpha subunit-like protein